LCIFYSFSAADYFISSIILFFSEYGVRCISLYKLLTEEKYAAQMFCFHVTLSKTFSYIKTVFKHDFTSDSRFYINARFTQPFIPKFCDMPDVPLVCFQFQELLLND